MLILEIEALSNGAHRNQITRENVVPPDGWAIVPQELEEEAISYLPFVEITVEDGKITGVAQGAVPAPEPEPAPEPTEGDDLMAMTIDHEYRITLLELGVF